MAIKILVVDDSATMRKILEMTFAGEDAQVVTADNAPAALAKAGDFRPNVILADTSMKPDGYELAQALRGQPTLAGTPLIVLASQQNPYDAARGSSSGVDDHIVKPFDTQALIDKVKAVVARGRAGAPQPSPAAAAPAPAIPAPAAPRPPMPPGAPVGTPGAPPRDLKRTMAFGTPLAPIANPVGPVQRTAESVVGPMPTASMPSVGAKAPALELADDEPIELRQPVAKPAAPPVAAAPVAPPRPPAPAPVAAAPAPVAPRPAPAPAAAPVPVAAAPRPVAPAPVAAPVAPAPAAKVAAATSQNGALAGKLAGLGLDANQIAGVLALSREVIEQVVWEVVPDLAETIIREELKRLTAD